MYCILIYLFFIVNRFFYRVIQNLCEDIYQTVKKSTGYTGILYIFQFYVNRSIHNHEFFVEVLSNIRHHATLSGELPAAYSVKYTVIGVWVPGVLNKVWVVAVQQLREIGRAHV